MNDEWKKRALAPIDSKTVWSAETDPDHSRTPRSEPDAGVGSVPANRHDRRKARKLLRKQQV